MAAENPTWGEEHIAHELKLKLGIRVSPRTVGKYMAQDLRRQPDPGHRWLTFVRNHAHAIVACDFFVVFTARFRILNSPRRHGTGQAPDPASQCDGASEC
jgi:putative transposase